MQRQVRSILSFLCLIVLLQPFALCQKVITTLLLSATPSPVVQPNANIFLTVGVSAADGTIPSPVTLSILDAPAPFATLFPNASGVATTNVQYTTGTIILVANYAGDATHLPSTAYAFLYVANVDVHDDVNIYDFPNPSLVGQPVTINVVVGGSRLQSFGYVDVTNGFTPYCTVYIGKGFGSCQYTFTKLGTYLIDVYFAGVGFSVERQTPQLVVSATTTTTSLLATPTHILRGQSTRLIASTATSYDGTPGVGTIYFRDGNVPLGSGRLTGFGESASIAVSTLQPGTHTIYADFVSSDPRFDNSTSSPATVTVSDDDFTLVAPSTLSVQTSHHVLAPISLASLGVFADTIQLGCSNLPQYASCIFQPQRQGLTPGSSATVTLWVDTDQVVGYASNSPGPITMPGGALAASLLFALCLVRRRRIRSLFLLATLGAVLISLTACSGKLPLSTPPGTYSFLLTGQGASTGISHTTPIQLNVTP